MNPKKELKNIDDYRKKRILHIHGTIDTSTDIKEANHNFVGKEDLLIKAIDDFLTKKLKYN